jgi:hypothetical protein
MKKILCVLLLSVFTNYCEANIVPVAKAKTVALNFLHSTIANSPVFVSDISLLTTEVVTDDSGNIVPAYYIFTGSAGQGFIIVSADDIVQPILGYSSDRSINMSNLSPSFEKWMEGYKSQIGFAVQNHMQPTDKIKAAWMDMFNNVFPAQRSPLAVSPLCNTAWDQQPYVNEMCPYDPANTTNQHCVTGCPATAMAQIMKYWNYPTQGSGIHAYNHDTYGTLSANFGATTYNWAAMPNYVNSSNSAVATLMYHCGVAVEMGYGANSSGSYVIINASPTPEQACEYAFKTYFGYDPSTIQGLERAGYSDASWITLLKTDLNASKPIQYAGYGGGGGHTFVCDGYDSSDNFHMNWGWGGSCDGYFAISALNPGSLGTGGGTGGFNSNQQALIGIQPLSTVPVGSGLQLYSSINITPSPIAFNSAFNVNVDITNLSTNTFNGDFTAALFNSSFEFVDYIQTLTGYSMPPSTHFTGGITFSTGGILTVPGNYYVGIFYREPGGNWSIVANGSYSNFKPVTISGPADYIKLNSPITPSATSFTQGQAASVNVNILNGGTSTYLGTYRVALYDLEGNFVQNIGTYTESAGLPAGYTYSTPLTFSTANVTASPGTYLLTVWEQEVGWGDYLAGGDLYTNPVYIDVVAAPLAPDIYETNNTASSAYALTLTFGGPSATVNTSGSNNHVGSDYDYYKINLATGYNYQITARVQDSYSSNDGNTYTNDVLWSYDTGSGFSEAYDDVMTSTIAVNGTGTVTFHVAPFFSGQVGTYRLDLDVSRVSAIGIDEIENDLNISFYPNPASESISFNFNKADCRIEKFELYDVTGSLITSQNSFENNKFDVSGLSEGIYFVSVYTNKGIVRSKFNVLK